MKWIKQGLIFEPKGNAEWMQTHAALPIANRIRNDLYRIYFSTRNSRNIASVGYIEVNIMNPKKILYLTKCPILSPGDMGCFDDSGVMAHSIVDYNNKKYMYYTGWNLGTTPFHWSIGLAISNDGGKTFQRYSESPILDRDIIDPYFVASPTVILENGKWKMWYISGIKWETRNPKQMIPYHIRYAESDDGVNWKRNGIVCIDFKKNETRIGRAAIIKEKRIYKMWYSYAVDQYRIGLAESKNGISWNRKDEEAGIDVSETGWDSEMIEYPFVFEYNGTKYMLYNGNNYGKTGFGYAVLAN